MSDAPESGSSDNALLGSIPQSAAPAPQEGQAPESQPVASPEVNADWLSGFDDDTKAYIDNKAWKSPGDMLESYQNLEKLRGVPAEQLFTIKPDMDDEGWNKVYNAMGRPENPDNYNLEVGETDSQELVSWFKTASHGLGFSDRQATELYSQFNEKMQSIATAHGEEQAAAHTKQIEALQKEWGEGFTHKAELAERALSSMGMSQEVMMAARDAGLGAEMAKFGAKLGEMMGEGQMRGMSPTDSRAAIGAMTPEEAKQQIDSKMADPQFMARYHSSDPQTRIAASKELDGFRKILASK